MPPRPAWRGRLLWSPPATCPGTDFPTPRGMMVVVMAGAGLYVGRLLYYRLNVEYTVAAIAPVSRVRLVPSGRT